MRDGVGASHLVRNYKGIDAEQYALSFDGRGRLIEGMRVMATKLTGTRKTNIREMYVYNNGSSEERFRKVREGASQILDCLLDTESKPYTNILCAASEKG